MVNWDRLEPARVLKTLETPDRKCGDLKSALLLFKNYQALLLCIRLVILLITGRLAGF